MKMKKLLALLFFILLIAHVALAAEGSLTITYQILDDTIRPGTETTVLLTARNSGTASSRDIKLSISAGPNINVSTNFINLGNLASSASQQTSLNIKIDPQAKASSSYLSIKATYIPDSTQAETHLNIPIKITTTPTLQVSDVKYNSSSIEPGNTVEMILGIANNGDGSAKDVKIILDQSDLFITMGTGEKFVNEIQPSEVVEFPFVLLINPSTAVGTYSIPVSITYADEARTSNFSVSKELGLSVTGSYNFLITLESQDTLIPGSKGTATIKVVNAGNQEAQFLTLQVLPSDPFADIIPQTSYIGNLKSDDYSTEKITLGVNKNAVPQPYPLNLELGYKNAYGKAYVETRSVYVKVYSESEVQRIGVHPLLILGIVVVIIIVAYILYKKFKRKR